MNMLARLMSQPIQDLKPAGDFYAPLLLDETFERECAETLALSPQPKPTPVDRLREGMDGIINTLRDRDADYDTEIEELEKRLAETREDKATNLAQLARIERAYDTLTETEKPLSRPSKSKKTEVVAG